MIRLSVIIVSYNVKSYLINCIRSVKKASQQFPVEIIVIDNASIDQSAESVVNEFPDVRLIKNDINLGYGSACNQGLSISKGDYLLILNPDTLVEENTFTHLLGFMEANREVGLVGCKILNEDGSLQLACRRSFPTPWIAFTKLSGLSYLFPKSKWFAKYNLTYLDENKPAEVDAVSGSFMLLSKSAYQKAGGFDEQFFMYAEDLDLCFRIKQSGFKVVYRPEASIIHFKGKSISSTVDTQFHFFHAMKLFVKKHHFYHNRMTGLLNLAISFRYLLSVVKKYYSVILAALLDVLLLLLGFGLSGLVRFGDWFPYPEFIFPQVYILLGFLQLSVFGWVGVYRKNILSKQKLLLGSFYVWLLIVLFVYFTKIFAYSRAVILYTFIFTPIMQLLWRTIVRQFNTSSLQQKAIIVSPELLLNKNEFISLQYELIQGVSLDQSFLFSNLKMLEEFVLQKKINLILIDSDQLDFSVQMELIQLAKTLSVKPQLISQKILHDTLLNNMTDIPDKTSFIFRLIKQITDRLLWLGFRSFVQRKMGIEKNAIFEYHPFSKNKKYFVGTKQIFTFQQEVLAGEISISDVYPTLRKHSELQLLNMVYQKYHNRQFDRRLLKKYFSELS